MSNSRIYRGGAAWPILKTAFFFAIVPTTVAGYVPYRILLRRAQWTWPAPGPAPVAGALLIALGVAGLLWCGWNFATTGRGTPAPFDPPKVLVVKGLYRWARNPMYASLATILVGESLFFQTATLLGYLAVCLLSVHLFVVLYEEPTLRQKFGPAYDDYCGRVGRWIPRPPHD